MITKGYVDFFHRHRYQYLWFFIMYACFWFWCVQSVILWLTLQFVNCVYIYILRGNLYTLNGISLAVNNSDVNDQSFHVIELRVLISNTYSIMWYVCLSCRLFLSPLSSNLSDHHLDKKMNSDIYMASKTAVGKTACACCVDCRFTDFVFEGLWVPKASQKYKSNFVNLNKNTVISYDNYMFENNKWYL